MRQDNFIIYQRSLDLVRVVREVLAHLPEGYAFIADQLRRAAGSITLNFSEGLGRASARDQRRFFVTARGSAYEVGAALDVAAAFGVLEPEIQAKAKDIADHLAAMLTKLI